MKRGPKPVSLTLAHKWLMDKGMSVAEFALKAGVHFTLAHRHLSGRGPVSRRICAAYMVAFPEGPWKAGMLETLTAKKKRDRIWA